MECSRQLLSELDPANAVSAATLHSSDELRYASPLGNVYAKADGRRVRLALMGAERR